MKPRIKMHRNSEYGYIFWSCSGTPDKPFGGSGDTPLEAYESWFIQEIPF